MNLYTFNKLKVGDKVRINKKGGQVIKSVLEKHYDFYDGIVIETTNLPMDGIIKIKINQVTSVFFPDEIDCKL